ncbi:hypothetical protein BT67DRAFT_156306 [Trichocladium antarcticum]|uniref:Uncharacterized protein n=1 Tax=Trichocladium antarcticum TaxID=1450529 RepID=A0AAN6ZBL9_9PEZI|nr:hypothetical protein BT67DRAFT_156306 [Trichocladium antarcticum]
MTSGTCLGCTAQLNPPPSPPPPPPPPPQQASQSSTTSHTHPLCLSKPLRQPAIACQQTCIPPQPPKPTPFLSRRLSAPSHPAGHSLKRPKIFDARPRRFPPSPKSKRLDGKPPSIRAAGSKIRRRTPPTCCPIRPRVRMPAYLPDRSTER